MWPRRVGLAGVVLAGSSGVAAAHEVGGTRFDAPVPLSLLYVGAGATVALTALWLGAAAGSRTGAGPTAEMGPIAEVATIPSRTGSLLANGARAAFLVGVVAALAHGFAGRQAPAANLATPFVWAAWIKGVGLVSILAGSPWRILSPWEALYDLLARIEGNEIAVLGGYPDRLGSWPALFGFVALVGIVENLTVVPRSPKTTAAVIAGYALFMLVGGVAFGRAWFRRADALAVLYRLFGRAAPLRVHRDDGRYMIRLRPPWSGATRAVGDLSLVVFAVASVYTVSFDGFSSTPEFQSILFGARDLLDTGPGTGALLYALGLGGFVASFLLAVAAAERAGSGEIEGWNGAARAFAATVLPIAAAYELAHNYPFVLRGAGESLAVSLDLLVGYGGGPIRPLGWLSLPAFWGSQVLLIVLGHVVAVIAAHRVALGRYEGVGNARRGHLPLVLAMVGYTVVSLWIVSRPVVSG